MIKFLYFKNKIKANFKGKSIGIIKIFTSKSFSSKESNSNNKVNSNSVPQRLNVEDSFFPYFVGLIEGYGLFTISKSGKYFQFEIGLELSIRDLDLINYIKSKLGVGTIFIRKSNNRPEMVIFRVRNKQDLKGVLMPIFNKYPLLTIKHYDFIRFKECLFAESNEIIKAHTKNKYIRPLTPVNTLNTILNAHYFSSWLIGFIESEACFSIYKPTNEN